MKKFFKEWYAYFLILLRLRSFILLIHYIWNEEEARINKSPKEKYYSEKVEKYNKRFEKIDKLLFD